MGGRVKGFLVGILLKAVFRTTVEGFLNASSSFHPMPLFRLDYTHIHNMLLNLLKIIYCDQCSIMV